MYHIDGIRGKEKKGRTRSLDQHKHKIWRKRLQNKKSVVSRI